MFAKFDAGQILQRENPTSDEKATKGGQKNALYPHPRPHLLPRFPHPIGFFGILNSSKPSLPPHCHLPPTPDLALPTFLPPWTTPAPPLSTSCYMNYANCPDDAPLLVSPTQGSAYTRSQLCSIITLSDNIHQSEATFFRKRSEKLCSL